MNAVEEARAWRSTAMRLVAWIYPCALCTVAIAVYGAFDEAFGVGRPLYCGQCVGHAKEPHPCRLVPRERYMSAALPCIDEARRGLAEHVEANGMTTSAVLWGWNLMGLEDGVSGLSVE
jgi:hypothetical protein